MTRFARIQRNKNSFARIPEEATSWAEFKEQMNKKREEQEEIDNVSRFPEEHFNSNVSKHVESNWCDFDQSSDGRDGNLYKNNRKNKQHILSEENSEFNAFVKKNKKHRLDIVDGERQEYGAESSSRIKKKKKQNVVECSKEEEDDYIEGTSSVQKNKKHQINVDIMGQDVSEETKHNSGVKKKKKHKQDILDTSGLKDFEFGEYSGGNEKMQKNDDDGNSSAQNFSENEEWDSRRYRKKNKPKHEAVDNTSQNLDITDEAEPYCMVKKEKKHKKSAAVESSTYQDDVCNNTEDISLVKNKRKQRSFDNSGNDDVYNDTEINDVKKHKKRYKQSIDDSGKQFMDNDSSPLVKKRNQGIFNDKGERKNDAENENRTAEFPRKKKKTIQENTKCFVDGKYVETRKFDGYYILDRDAERLQKLREELLKKGRPKQVVEGIIRRERRNAEKSLSRKKKKLCFHCREGIHNLSECPKLGGASGRTNSTNICYKCGSPEHSLYQCKVPGNVLKFAKCFICNESGHLSKQCPDNPRGLYPNGGSCRMCGDVTHLKRDCPELIKRKKHDTITVGTIQDGVDSLDEDKKSKIDSFTGTKRANKVIKF